ncbi:hypothetical protein ACS0TY_002905 [Phlomoides rotata]
MTKSHRCPYDIGDLVKQCENLLSRHNAFNWILLQSGVLHDSVSNRMFMPPEVLDRAAIECGNAQMYFYYRDDRWEALKKIFRTDGIDNMLPGIVAENMILSGRPNHPIVIESSVSSSSSVRPCRQFSNSLDQESDVSDINSWKMQCDDSILEDLDQLGVHLISAVPQGRDPGIRNVNF